MSQDAILVICQYGGEFVVGSDGSMSYDGGEAHAIDITHEMTFNDLKSEISHMFESDESTFTIKYFLPKNKKTLITISNDRDLKRMINFHKSSMTTDLFVMDKTEKRITRSNAEANTNTSSHAAPTTLSPRRISSSRALTEEEEFTPGRMTGEWANAITGPGQEFRNSRDMRDALRMYAIAKGFMYKFIKNDGSRVTAACKAEGCPWRIHASRSSAKKKFMIKKISGTHTCGGVAQKGNNRLASQQWLSNLIKEKLKDSPHLKPRDITNEFYRDFGINLNYSQAWRGKEIARRELYDSHSEACTLLPWLCKRILETNAGSFATLLTKEDSRFHRIFVSFHASLQGFEHGCHPLLFLNGLDLKMNKKYKFLSATAIDGENEIFPVSFAVVEDESHETWLWFLELLKLALSTSRVMTLVSDRRHGLEEAVSQVFEESEHAFCFEHLMELFKAELEGLMVVEESKDSLIEDFINAAHAFTVEEFDACVERIRSVSEDLAAWVGNSKPELWSNAFFKGFRYGHLSSSVTELFEDWIPVKEQSSVVQIIDVVRCKIMETIHLRRESSMNWMETTLTPSAEQKLQREIAKSRSINVTCLAENVFQVREGDETVNAVNLETWDCTCRRWKATGLPCKHVIAVVDRTRANAYEFCSKYLTMQCYRLTYSSSLNPIPDVGRPVCPDPVHGKSSLLSRARRLPGRPKGKPTEPKKTSTRKIRCSVCNEVGHNKATCKASPATPTSE